MEQTCQIRFDDNKRICNIDFIVNDVRRSASISFEDVRRGRIPSLLGHKAHKFTYDEFKKAAVALSKSFAPDLKSSLSWTEQYCLELAKISDKLYALKSSNELTPEQFRDLKRDISKLGKDFLAAVGISEKEYSQAYTVGYCMGVDTLFCTSDYLSIRRGDVIVARINLPGNDYNDLKSFLQEASKEIMSEHNIESMRAAIKQMKMDEATRLVNSESKQNKGKGLSLFNNDVS